MKLKKVILLILSLAIVLATLLSLTSCGKDAHERKLIDDDGDGICDECGTAEKPCEGGHGELYSLGYCKDCGFLSEDYPNFKLEHKNHADTVHGDGLCDECGAVCGSASDFSKKLDMFHHGFIEKEGYKEVLHGLLVTVEIAILGLFIGIVLGTLIAVVKVMPKSSRITRVLESVCDVYVGFFRGTPMVVQLLIGYFVLLPMLGIMADGVVVAIVIFGLNSAAYVSEIMRAGIQSVDVGQLEAGRAVGLPYSVAMMKIVIPQSVKNILPTLGNEFIVLIKETSIVSFIAVVDVTKAFKSIADANYEYLIPYVALAVVYLALVMLITLGIKTLERRLKRNERQ